jgi:hypothetical protein
MKGNNKATACTTTVKFMWALCVVLLFCLYFWYTTEHPHETLFHVGSLSAKPFSALTPAEVAKEETQAKAKAATAAHIETHDAMIAKTHHDYETILPEIIPIPPAARDLAYRTLYDVVTKWSPDDPEVPENFRETLQHFNYGDPFERSVAEKYRNAELPFKVYNISEFLTVSHLWTDAYLSEKVCGSRALVLCCFEVRFLKRTKKQQCQARDLKYSAAGITNPCRFCSAAIAQRL